MIVKNTTKFHTSSLRKIIRWCLKQYEFPINFLDEASFTNTKTHYFRGRAWRLQKRILIRIHVDEEQFSYPLQYKYRNRTHAPTMELIDQMESLVLVVAHEIAHHVRWQHTKKNREARVDGMALQVLKNFRQNRDQLLNHWAIYGNQRESNVATSA